MKKVIPKKKDAFAIIPIESIVIDNPDLNYFQSPSFIAGENINTGDLLMVRKKDGLIVPFTGSEGRKYVWYSSYIKDS